MGPYPPHVAGPGNFSSQVRMSYQQESYKEAGGGYYYSLIVSAMEEARFEEIGVYIQTRQNTVIQNITTRNIIDFGDRSVRSSGVWVSCRC